MKALLLRFLMVLSLGINTAHAQDHAEQAKITALLGGVTISLAALAAEKPSGFGEALFFLSPLAGLDTEGNYKFLFTTLGLMTVGAYNKLELDDERYLKGERFRQNLILMPLAVGGGYLLGNYLDKNETVALTQIGRGFGVMYSRRF